MSDQCKATYEHKVTYLNRWVGVQCKYTTGHMGRHCAYTGYNDGDVFWNEMTDRTPGVARADNKTPCQAEGTNAD